MESPLMLLEESSSKSSTLVQQQQHEQKNKNDDKIRPWVDLPSELLGLVFSGLYDPDHILFSSIRDQIGFRLTCKGWQSSVHCCLLGEQFPFLMSLKPRNGTGAYNFFNPITNKEIQVFDDCYDMVSRAHLHCSRFGWLLMSREYSISLFFYNPFISGTTIKLPPFSGGMVPIEYMDSMSFTAPPTSSDCIVYVHDFYHPTKPREVVGIYRWCYGEDNWTYYLIDCQLPFGKSSGNPILYRSVFYQLNKCGRLGISDPKKGNEQHIWKDLPRPKPLKKKKNIYSPYTNMNKNKRMRKQPPKPQEEDIIRSRHYMAECDGKLVMVCVDYKGCYRVQSVHVFELDWYRMEWVTVQSLGNKAMFICEAESLLINMTTGGGAENKIYFPAFVNTNEDGVLIYPSSKFFCDDGVRATKKVGVFYCLKNHEFNSPLVYWDWASSCTWIDTKFQL